MTRIQWLVLDIRRQRKLVAGYALQVARDRAELRRARQQIIARTLNRLAKPEALAASFAAGFLLGLRSPRRKALPRPTVNVGSLGSLMMPALVWTTRWLLENARERPDA